MASARDREIAPPLPLSLELQEMRETVQRFPLNAGAAIDYNHLRQIDADLGLVISWRVHRRNRAYHPPRARVDNRNGANRALAMSGYLAEFKKLRACPLGIVVVHHNHRIASEEVQLKVLAHDTGRPLRERHGP